MPVPTPVRYDEEVTRFPFKFLSRDFAGAAALDDIIELVRRVPMLLRLFVAIKHLDPTGERRKRRTAGDRIAIFQTLAVEGVFALRKCRRQSLSRLAPFINQRLERLAGRREQTG